jgi:hypothetical protein
MVGYAAAVVNYRSADFSRDSAEVSENSQGFLPQKPGNPVTALLRFATYAA